MRKVRLLSALTVWCCISLSLASPGFAEIQNICAGLIPAGWIAINDSWNPTACGNPTSIVYNIVTIERYDNKPKGSQMQACAGPVPAGWAVVGTRWNPSVCGHPTAITQNVMTIRKMN